MNKKLIRGFHHKTAYLQELEGFKEITFHYLIFTPIVLPIIILIELGFFMGDIFNKIKSACNRG